MSPSIGLARVQSAAWPELGIQIGCCLMLYPYCPETPFPVKIIPSINDARYGIREKRIMRLRLGKETARWWPTASRSPYENITEEQLMPTTRLRYTHAFDAHPRRRRRAAGRERRR